MSLSSAVIQGQFHQDMEHVWKCLTSRKDNIYKNLSSLFLQSRNMNNILFFLPFQRKLRMPLILTWCVSVWWGLEHDGCSWQDPVWRPVFAVFSPRSLPVSNPARNRVSFCLHPTHQFWQDVSAKHYLKRRYNDITVYISIPFCL